MATSPTFSELFKSMTLGTVRHPPDEAVLTWLDDMGAIDPTADGAEQLLAAYGLLERAERLRPSQIPAGVIQQEAEAPPETGQAPTPRLARGLQLILEGTYPELLDEGIRLVRDRDTYVPAPLLPLLLPRAVAQMDQDAERAQRYLGAGGKRARWLAAQHPEWSALTSDYPFAERWRSADQPAVRAQLLRHWRRVDPAVAGQALRRIWSDQSPRNQEVLLEGLRDTLTDADTPWLREALEPKRKGVRRAIAELLLLAREPQAVADFRAIAENATAADGSIAANPPGQEMRELLQLYGGTKAPESLGQRLLEVMPPDSWSDIVPMAAQDLWLRLRPLELRAAARAILQFGIPDYTRQMVTFLIREEPKGFDMDLAGKLVRKLDDATFDDIYTELLNREKDALRLRGVSRYLALQRDQYWSERLSKAMVTRLLDDLHQRQLDYSTQRDLGLHWKQATPLLHPDVFPWLRKQLHTTTERYDAFGQLATRMLQVTSFRRQLREP